MNKSQDKSISLVCTLFGSCLLLAVSIRAAAQDIDVPSVTVIPLDSAEAKSAPQPRVITPNTVAVLDLGVRREHRDFFFDEKFDQKIKLKGSQQAGLDIRSDGASGDRGLDDSRPSPQVFRQAGVINEGRGEDTARIAVAKSVDFESSTNYSRQYGFKRSLSYKELRGLMTDIRGALTSAGYTVRYVGPPDLKDPQAGQVPTFVDRLRAGDFGDAEFVVIPNVVDISQRQMKEPIQGTQDFANRLELNLSAEFTMVSTRDLSVVASFNAFGSGADIYIGRQGAVFTPDSARIVRDVISSFGDDSKRKLVARLPKPSSSEPQGGSAKIFGSVEGDPKTFKVYKSTETKIEATGTDRSVEQKTEIRVFR